MSNFTYDPTRHPPEVKRVLDHMTSLINSGQRSRQDVVGALTEAIEFVADANKVDYAVIQAIVFGAMDRDNGEKMS